MANMLVTLEVNQSAIPEVSRPIFQASLANQLEMLMEQDWYFPLEVEGTEVSDEDAVEWQVGDRFFVSIVAPMMEDVEITDVGARDMARVFTFAISTLKTAIIGTSPQAACLDWPTEEQLFESMSSKSEQPPLEGLRIVWQQALWYGD